MIAGSTDKVDNLQYAFFNGVGYESWENIWGIWNGIAPRDAEALRRIAKIERAFARFPGESGMGAARAHASSTASMPAAGRLQNRTLWTIVNRNQTTTSTARRFQLPAQSGIRYYDLWHGVELTPETPQ